MTFLSFASNDVAVSAQRADGLSATVPLCPDELTDHPSIGPAAKAFNTAFVQSTALSSELLRDLSEEGWAKAFPEKIAPILHSPVKNIIAAAAAAMKDVTERRAELLTPATPLPPATATELRAHMRSLKPADAISLALTDRDVALAVLDNWKLSGLPKTIRDRVEEFVMRGTAIERAKAIAPMATPTLSDPLRSGPDMAWVDHYVDEWMKKLEDSHSTAKATVEFARSAVNFIALLGDEHHAEAVFAKIMKSI